ncbi:hypothetical protein DFH94DRAFT_769741 [Russula ochroleuca]|uniref:Uncharacterized protein n=1 Tax=Russula ochroleuca TaxID=152965 RepID=A0A9P5JZ78_9AGAM|nr:hypothetical protein DFH94DRAFT_769741 [Russula ochroleuca]
MPNNVSQNHSPDALGSVLEVTIDGIVDVTSPFIARNIIDGLRRRLTVSSQMKEGDYFMDQSRILLRRHLQLIEVREQVLIRQNIDVVRNIKNGLVNFTGSRLEKFREARKYRRLSKMTYRIVKTASERGIDGHLMGQIAEAVQQHGGDGSGSGPDTVLSTLTDVAVGDLDRVEMSTYQDGDTGEAAVVLDVIAQDESVQHIVATFPTGVFSGVRTERGAPEVPVALSLHQEDGTMPRVIVASLPDLSQDQEETRSLRSLNSLTSITSSELIGTSEGSSFYPEPRP